MTLREMEDELQQWKVMVHYIKKFQPGQLHKLTWEDQLGNEYSMFFDKIDSLDDLIRQIKWQLSLQKIDTSPEADLIINYK